MEEKNRRDRRWTNLLLAALWGAMLWMRMGKYQEFAQLTHIYSPEELARVLSDLLYGNMIYGLLVLNNLWQFLTWKLSRPGMGTLTDGVCHLLTGLLWGCLWLAGSPGYWQLWKFLTWIGLLVLLLGSGTYNLWKYRKRKLYEETL